jgi:hypothetical protein
MKSVRKYVREMKCNLKSKGNEMCKKKCENNLGKNAREM